MITVETSTGWTQDLPFDENFILGRGKGDIPDDKGYISLNHVELTAHNNPMRVNLKVLSKNPVLIVLQEGKTVRVTASDMEYQLGHQNSFKLATGRNVLNTYSIIFPPLQGAVAKKRSHPNHHNNELSARSVPSAQQSSPNPALKRLKRGETDLNNSHAISVEPDMASSLGEVTREEDFILTQPGDLEDHNQMFSSSPSSNSQRQSVDGQDITLTQPSDEPITSIASHKPRKRAENIEPGRLSPSHSLRVAKPLGMLLDAFDGTHSFSSFRLLFLEHTRLSLSLSLSLFLCLSLSV